MPSEQMPAGKNANEKSSQTRTRAGSEKKKKNSGVIEITPAQEIALGDSNPPNPSETESHVARSSAPAINDVHALPSLSESISIRAYEIWLAEDCPQGKALDHWLRAEQELLGGPH